MKKIFSIILLLVIFVICKGQTVDIDLHQRNVIRVDDKLLVCGYSYEGTRATFKATLYDAKLNLIKKYDKAVPFESDNVRGYQIMYGEVLLVWMPDKPNGYLLKLTKDLKEISFYENTPENETIRDETHFFLSQIQLGLEGDPYGAGAGVGVFFSNRQNAITNKRFLKNDILDFDLKTDMVTRCKLNETKMYPTFTPIWKSKLTENTNVKLTGFTYADEDEIIACFIVKEDEWKDYVSKIDSKTGDVIYFKEAKFPEESEIFNISNTFYDKSNGNLIVVGQLLLRKRGKDLFNALGILVYDSKGEMLHSKKIIFPEIEIVEPRGFDFNNKLVIAYNIEKLPNGNYSIGCQNKVQGAPAYSGGSPISEFVIATKPMTPGKGVVLYTTVAFSFYELNDKLEIIKSGFKMVQKFNQKNTLTTCLGFSKNNKKVIYSQLDIKTKTFFVLDFNSNALSEANTIETSDYNMKKDIFIPYVFDKNIIIFERLIKGDISSLKSFSFK